MVRNFIARLDRATGDYTLLVDGFKFAELVNCEVCHVFVTDNLNLGLNVNEHLMADMCIRDRLEVIKTIYNAMRDEEASINKAECDAENAWARHAERYDHEAQEDLALHDFLHPNGYGG